eukprot:c25819_g1_i2 orf=1029-1346(+)
MMEEECALEVPEQQKMERLQTLKIEQKEEHRAALEKAVTLKIPHALSPSPETSQPVRLDAETDEKAMLVNDKGASSENSGAKPRTNWDNSLVEMDNSENTVQKEE